MSRDLEKKNAYQRQYFRKGGPGYAKQRARIVARQQEMKKWLHSLKEGRSCSQCDESHPACLDYHHRDPSVKEIEISRIVRWKGWGKARILAEIAKCDLLCSNCHRKLHADMPSTPSGSAA